VPFEILQSERSLLRTGVLSLPPVGSRSADALVDASPSSEDEAGEACQVIDEPPSEMVDAGSGDADRSAPSLLRRESVEQVEVLVVAVDEERRPRSVGKASQAAPLLGCPRVVPEESEVPQHDEKILFAQPLPLGKEPFAEPRRSHVTVHVSGQKYPSGHPRRLLFRSCRITTIVARSER